MTTYAHEAEELYGPLVIPRGPMGPMISTKDDYAFSTPEYIEGARMTPAAVAHEIGERVRVTRIAGCAASLYESCYPRGGQLGTVIACEGERLWRVGFEDGTTACYYGAEIEREA